MNRTVSYLYSAYIVFLTSTLSRIPHYLPIYLFLRPKIEVARVARGNDDTRVADNSDT